MAFSTIEISNQDGQPIRLYEFQYGETFWRYASADEDIEFGTDDEDNPIVWTATAINDTGFTQGGSDQNDLRVLCQSDIPLVSLFRLQRPSGKVWLTVRQFHLEDNEAPVHWIGTVVNAIAQDEASTQLNCRSLAGTYDRQGLRLGWSRSCPHPLYGIGCRVNKEDHAYPRTVATLTGNRFTCTTHSEPAEGSFTGGFLEFIRPDGSLETKAIERQSGNDFLILGSTGGLEIGTAVTLYPGCARDTPNCKLFDNLKNYGGFPHLPGESPFSGSPVF